MGPAFVLHSPFILPALLAAETMKPEEKAMEEEASRMETVQGPVSTKSFHLLLCLLPPPSGWHTVLPAGVLWLLSPLPLL